MIINGIPYQRNENIRSTMKDLAETLKVEIKEFDIVAAHRLPSKTEVAPIIVKFKDF